MQVVRIVDEAFWIYTPAHDIIDEEAIEGQEKGFDRASTASGRDESAGLGQTTATLVDPASGVPDRQSEVRHGKDHLASTGAFKAYRGHRMPVTANSCSGWRVHGVLAIEEFHELRTRPGKSLRALLSREKEKNKHLQSVVDDMFITVSSIRDTALTGVLRLFKFYLGTLHRNATIMQVVRNVDEAFWIYTPAHDIIDEEAIEGQGN
ncbi:hypothetical protein QTP88_013704 [Uroleucon formosanum]